MIFGLVLTLAFVLKISCVDPPFEVLVIDSYKSQNSQHFILRDVMHMLRRPNYSQVVDMTILPIAQIREIVNNDGTFNYTHQYGAKYLELAQVELCVNSLYPVDMALKWAVFSMMKEDMDVRKKVQHFFKADHGAAVLGCIDNATEANALTHEAYQVYLAHPFNGTLPFIVIDNNATLYVPFKTLFLADMCSRRADRAELPACARNNTLGYLDSESDSTPVEVKPKEFDFENFWNNYDD